MLFAINVDAPLDHNDAADNNDVHPDLAMLSVLNCVGILFSAEMFPVGVYVFVQMG